MVSPFYLITDAEESDDREQEAYFSSQNTFQFFFRIILFFFFKKSLCTNNAEDRIRSSDYIRCSLLSITITSPCYITDETCLLQSSEVFQY